MAKLTKEQREERARLRREQREQRGMPDRSRVEGLENSLKNITESLKRASTDTQKPFIELHDEFTQVQDDLEAQGKKFSSTAKLFSRHIDDIYEKSRNASADDLQRYRKEMDVLFKTARESLQDHESKAIEDQLHKYDAIAAREAKARKRGHHKDGMSQSFAMRHEDRIKDWGKSMIKAPILQRLLIDKPLAKHRQKVEGDHQSREKSADFYESIKRSLLDELRFNKRGSPRPPTPPPPPGQSSTNAGTTGTNAAQPGTSQPGPSAQPNAAHQNGEPGTTATPQPPIPDSTGSAGHAPLDVDWDSVKPSSGVPFPPVNALLPDAEGPHLHTLKPKPAAMVADGTPQPATGNLTERLDAVIKGAETQETGISDVKTSLDAEKAEQGSALKEQTGILREILRTLTTHFRDQSEATELTNDSGHDNEPTSEQGIKEKLEEKITGKKKPGGKGKGEGGWLKKLMKGGEEGGELAEGAEAAEGGAALAEGASAIGAGTIAATAGAVIVGAGTGLALGKGLEKLTSGHQEASEKKGGMSALDWHSKFAEWMNDQFHADVNTSPAWYQPEGNWVTSIDSNFDKYSKESPGGFKLWLRSKYPDLAHKTPGFGDETKPAAPVIDAAKKSDEEAKKTVDKPADSANSVTKGAPNAVQTPANPGLDKAVQKAGDSSVDKPATPTATTPANPGLDKAVQKAGVDKPADPTATAPAPAPTTPAPAPAPAPPTTPAPAPPTTPAPAPTTPAPAADAHGSAPAPAPGQSSGTGSEATPPIAMPTEKRNLTPGGVTGPQGIGKAMGVGGGGDRNIGGGAPGGTAKPGSKEHLNEIAAAAIKAEKETGVPAKMMIAQWATESGWGKNKSGDFNYFGITKSARHKNGKLVPTSEDVTYKQFQGFKPEEQKSATEMDGSPLKPNWDGKKKIKMSREFASYGSLDEAMKDYAGLISKGKPYKQAMENYKKTGDQDQFMRDVGKVYATDRNYGDTITKIGNQKNVQDAIKTAQTSAPPAPGAPAPGAPAGMPTLDAAAKPPVPAPDGAAGGVRLATASQENAIVKTQAANKPAPPPQVAAAKSPTVNQNSNTTVSSPVTSHNNENTFQRAQQLTWVNT